jgi:ADP-ribosylglycohydrolase
MRYPKIPDFKRLTEELELYTQLKSEYGAKGISTTLSNTAKALQSALAELKSLPIDSTLEEQEPNDLRKIQSLRPTGPRRLWNTIDKATYCNRLEGALLGRMAGCTLGASVEFWPIDQMKQLAEENGDVFPPDNYWLRVPEPKGTRYQMSRREEYTRSRMSGVPVDDDLAYTLLGLLIMEEYGPDFSVEDIGNAWLKHLPYACTAEDIALRNLKKGIPATKVGEKDNPYCEWIGAFIRADPWGYMAPGWPERAAAMAYQDAYISHRRQGIYGEMFFAATIAAAFTTDNPVEALHIGLTEIPRDSALSKAIRWALKVSPEIKDYQQARDAVGVKFAGMNQVHTINNACLTVWGITIGGTDFSKVIGQTVAMGMDNDCTAATAGSIVGAVVGKKGIPGYWYENFNDTIHSYLINRRQFSISDVVRRFEVQAKRVYSQLPNHL